MDKYELVLDIIEHPENYTSEQLADILSDSEIREIYNLLCKTDSAVEADKEIDVEAEWKNFSKKNAIGRSRSFLRFGSRAASIAAIICTSIMAVAAGIAVTMSVIEHKAKPTANNEVKNTTISVAVSTDTITEQIDTVKVDVTTIMFEDEPLEAIMKNVAIAYGVDVKFNNKEAASLHLYYQLDPSLPLNEVIEQLNTFDQINIMRSGNILNID